MGRGGATVAGGGTVCVDGTGVAGPPAAGIVCRTCPVAMLSIAHEPSGSVITRMSGCVGPELAVAVGVCGAEPGVPGWASTVAWLPAS